MTPPIAALKSNGRLLGREQTADGFSKSIISGLLDPTGLVGVPPVLMRTLKLPGKTTESKIARSEYLLR